MTHQNPNPQVDSDRPAQGRNAKPVPRPWRIEYQYRFGESGEWKPYKRWKDYRKENEADLALEKLERDYGRFGNYKFRKVNLNP